jgi:hypothetical protein
VDAPSSASKANVGKNVVVKGHPISGEDLTIFGEVEGTIDIGEHRLTIAADGAFEPKSRRTILMCAAT